MVVVATIFTPINSVTAEASHHEADAKTVLITGANRGLGLEFARQYAASGWKIIGTARNPEKAAELNKLGARVMQLDVADAESVAKFADA